jgi:hypothetical protein
MNESERTEYLRKMQEAMRPMTEEEMAEMQLRAARGMQNNPETMRGCAGMRNFWSLQDQFQPEPKMPKPTRWQRFIWWLRGA